MTRSPGWRGALASAAAAAVLIAAPLVGAGTAHATPPAPHATAYPPQPSCVTVSATTVHPGDTVTFSGTGFTPGQQVDVLLRPPNTVLGTFTADANGNVSGQVTIPQGTKPGYYQFTLLNHGGPFRVCAARITVVTTTALRAGQGGPVDAAHQGEPVDAAHQGGEPVDAAHQGGTPSHSGLANTGSGKALALGGAAAGLIAAGGGTMLAVRRRRSS